MLFYAVWMNYQVVLRYNTFEATAFDLGNMDQATWNTLHGRPFQFTNHGADWYGYPIRLAQHVEPIFLLLSLLYTFHANPCIILTFQTLALTAGALPIFLLTRKFVPIWPLLAPVLAAAYLFSPAVMGENLFDFHPVVLVTPLILYTVLALTYRRYAWFVICCILAAACKEEIPTALALFGLLIIWKYKIPRLGIALLVVGIAWSLIAFLVVEPHFNIGAQTNNFWYRYKALGSSPTAAIVNILYHPWILFSMYFQQSRIYYVINLLRSTGFLALLGPEWLLPTLCSLAINILSKYHPFYSGVYHYNAAIIPFIMIASIHGCQRFAVLWYSWRGETKNLEILREASALRVPVHRTINGQERHRIAIANSRLFQTLHRYSKIGRKAIAKYAPIPSPETIHRYSKIGRKAIAKYAPIPSPETIQRIGTTLRSNWTKSSERFHARGADLARWLPISLFQSCFLIWIVGMTALNYFVMSSALNPFWADHQLGAHEQQVEQILAMIPPDAPVSASGTLNPHLTERQYITTFPELNVATMTIGKTMPVEYVIVDLYDISPDSKGKAPSSISTLNWLERTSQFRVLAQANGVILLKRNTP
jgi:uncharacterized membrane protein